MTTDHPFDAECRQWCGKRVTCASHGATPQPHNTGRMLRIDELYGRPIAMIHTDTDAYLRVPLGLVVSE